MSPMYKPQRDSDKRPNTDCAATVSKSRYLRGLHRAGCERQLALDSILFLFQTHGGCCPFYRYHRTATVTYHVFFFFFLVISLYPGIYHIIWSDKVRSSRLLPRRLRPGSRYLSASGGQSLACVKLTVCETAPGCLTSQTSFLPGNIGPQGWTPVGGSN